MNVCKNCGNYYKFIGSAITTVNNKLNPTGRDKYEEEADIQYEEVDFINCNECGSNDVADVDVNALPIQLKEEVYNTLTMGCIDENVMKNLKVFINK